MSNPHFFITGCPRSGTTLLERIIGTHPSIAVPMGSKGILHRFEKREGLTPDGFVTAGFADGHVDFRPVSEMYDSDTNWTGRYLNDEKTYGRVSPQQKIGSSGVRGKDFK